MRVVNYHGYGIDLAKISFMDQDYAKYFKLLLHPAFLKDAIHEFNRDSAVKLNLLITNNHRQNIYLFGDHDTDETETTISDFIAISIWNEYANEHSDLTKQTGFITGVKNELQKSNYYGAINEYALISSFAGDSFVPAFYQHAEVVQ